MIREWLHSLSPEECVLVGVIITGIFVVAFLEIMRWTQ